MNKFHFDEHQWDIWKCDWLIGHIISINMCESLVVEIMPKAIEHDNGIFFVLENFEDKKID